MQLPEFDWLLINELLYKVHKAEDHRRMCSDCLQHLRLLVRFDRACIQLAGDGGNLSVEAAVGLGFSPGELDRCLELYTKKNNDFLISICTESRPYRIGDYISEEKWEEHPFFGRLEQEYGVRYLVRLPLLHKERLVGLLSLFRSRSDVDLSDRELFILDTTKRHLALALHRLTMGQAAAPVPASSAWEELAKQQGLTQRETEILGLMVQGAHNEEIAQQLCIAPNTQKKHVLNIYRKLAISSRSDLIRLLRD